MKLSLVCHVCHIPHALFRSQNWIGLQHFDGPGTWTQCEVCKVNQLTSPFDGAIACSESLAKRRTAPESKRVFFTGDGISEISLCTSWLRSLVNLVVRINDALCRVVLAAESVWSWSSTSLCSLRMCSRRQDVCVYIGFNWKFPPRKQETKTRIVVLFNQIDAPIR